MTHTIDLNLKSSHSCNSSFISNRCVKPSTPNGTIKGSKSTTTVNDTTAKATTTPIKVLRTHNSFFDTLKPTYTLPSPCLLKRYRCSVMPSNEELNNKLDVEIRILDGILKLLNAITSHDSHLNDHSGSSSSSHNTPHQQQLDHSSVHLSQLLNTCKCLFVSHRKIAIYINDLQKAQRSPPPSPPPQAIVETQLDGGEVIKSKVYLSNIRVPLSWKWNDYLKATKNSENVTSKYAAFALVYAGNMVYDTQLALNIDPTVTDLSFNEEFEFDDVDINNFDIKIEFYSYEIQNTAHTHGHIIQSTRKFAKSLLDIVKRSLSSPSSNQTTNSSHYQHNGSILNASFSSQLSQSFNSNTNVTEQFTYASMHRFKLCGQANLNQTDLSDSVETKNLKIINNDSAISDHSSTNSTTLSTNYNTINYQQPPSSTTTTTTLSPSNGNRLPLFDQFCCLLHAK